MVSTPPDEYGYDDHRQSSSDRYKNSTAGVSTYIDESHQNAIALEAASQNLKDVYQDISDYTWAMSRLAQRNYEKEDQGWAHRAKRSLSNVSRVKAAAIWALAGTVVPFVGTTIGAIIGFTGKDIIKYLWKEQGVYEELATGGMIKLRDKLQATLNSANDQHPLLLASLANMESRHAELIAGSDDATILAAQIQNTKNLIQLYKTSVMELLRIAPIALDYLQSAINAYHMGDITQTLADTSSGLREMTNQSVEAAFTITAKLSERIAKNAWVPLLTDKTLRWAATALTNTQTNIARIAHNTKQQSSPNPLLLALAAASKQEKPTKSPVIELPNNPE